MHLLLPKQKQKEKSLLLIFSFVFYLLLSTQLVLGDFINASDMMGTPATSYQSQYIKNPLYLT